MSTTINAVRLKSTSMAFGLVVRAVKGVSDGHVPGVPICDACAVRMAPKYQANRRAAPMPASNEPHTGPGSCTALIDTWLQALLPLEGDGREVA